MFRRITKQPKPIFFTPEQIKRMEKQEGSYQFKGGKDGKKTETH